MIQESQNYQNTTIKPRSQTHIDMQKRMQQKVLADIAKTIENAIFQKTPLSESEKNHILSLSKKILSSHKNPQ